jgi:hypothetical protein
LVLLKTPSLSSAERKNLSCLEDTKLLYDILHERCFLVIKKKHMEAKSFVGPTLFKLKSKPALTSLPEDRRSSVNLKRAFSTRPPLRKRENLPEFHSGARSGGFSVREEFYPLFLCWFTCCLCVDTHEILIIDVWWANVSELLGREPISDKSVTFYPSRTGADGILNLFCSVT